MAGERILIADDDIHILKMASRILQSEGMETEQFANGNDALTAALNHPYELLLLDINMDGKDGFTIVKEVRKQGISTPIIIISGNAEEYNTIFGLSIGADDYLTKPVSPAVLSAKVKALLRRNKTAMESSAKWIERGPFRFDTETYRFYKNNREILLTAKEKQLLLLFLKHINQVFTKEMLYEQVWNNSVIDDNTIMVNIRNIRKKIEDNPKQPHYLQTEWGVGYRFTM